MKLTPKEKLTACNILAYVHSIMKYDKGLGYYIDGGNFVLSLDEKTMNDLLSASDKIALL